MLALDTIFINTIQVLINKIKKVIMKYISNMMKASSVLAVSAMMILSSCNKDLEQFKETTPTPTGLSIEETLLATPGDSLFNRIVIKGGMAATLNDKNLTHTLFVPDNNAVIASFGGSLATANGTIAALSAASCAGIVKYNMLPQILTSAQIAHDFPNLQQPTDIILDPTNPLVRMTAFPSKNASTNLFYYNNVPLTTVDLTTANGIIHHTAFVAAPPTGVLKTLINADPNLTYFSAAIVRADSGQTGLNRLDSLLNYAVTNMTVFAPNDAAFQTVIYGLVYAQVFAATGSATIADQQATMAVAAGPVIFQNPALFGALPAASVRGIVAYHLLAYINPISGGYEPIRRVFTVNLPNGPAPTFLTTLVNSSIAIHPGIMALVSYTGPFATVTVNGYGTFPPGGAPFSGTPANLIGPDKLGVNGVYHIIDKVLFPQ